MTNPWKIGVGCVLGLLATQARGEDKPPASELGAGSASAVTTPDQETGWRWVLAGGAEHQFSTDIDGGGEFSVTRYGVGVGVLAPINANLTLAAGVGYELLDYDFSGGAEPEDEDDVQLGADPWDIIHSVRFRATLNWQIDEHWSVFGGPLVGFSAEEGADIGDAMTYGVLAGGGYRFSDELALSIGALVISQIEDSVTVFPIIRFDWKIAENWTLRSGTFDLGSEGGAGVELSWQPCPTAEISVGAQYQTRRFRLDDEEVAPDGVGEESGLPVYVRGTWHFCPHASVSIVGGAIFAGELELDDNDGHRLRDEDFDPAPFLGGRVSVRF